MDLTLSENDVLFCAGYSKKRTSDVDVFQFLFQVKYEPQHGEKEPSTQELTYAQVARGRIFYQAYYKDELKRRKEEQQSLARIARVSQHDKDAQHDDDARNEYYQICASRSSSSSSSSSSNSMPVEPVASLTKKEKILKSLEELFSESIHNCLSMQVIVDHFPDMVGVNEDATLGEVLRSIATHRKGQWTHK